MLTIRPARARSIGFSARRVSRKAAVRSVSITDSHASSPSDGVRSSALIPALLTSTRTGRSKRGLELPRTAGRAPPDRRRRAASATARPPAASISPRRRSAPASVGAVVDADRPAVGGDRAGDRRADPARGAGDQRAAVGARLSHGSAPRPDRVRLASPVRTRPGPTSTNRSAPALVQREHRLAPAHRHRQRVGQLAPRVGERLQRSPPRSPGPAASANSVRSARRVNSGTAEAIIGE